MSGNGVVIAVVGTQFGDEGKGRFIDNLIRSEKITHVARYNGGPNAGHKLSVGNQTISLHAMPSGIFYDDICNVIGNGTVINPIKLAAELADIAKLGIKLNPKTLVISNCAHLILPSYIIEDIAKNGHIGTTAQGIGPAYMAKAQRSGKLAAILENPEDFAQLVTSDARAAISQHGKTLEEWLGITEAELTEAALSAAKVLQPHLGDTGALLRSVLKQGKTILAEGAQSTLLDINHGTYPYVTSSSATSAGVAPGLGIPPTAIREVFGVAKLTMSRVGEGPFPTEITEGELLGSMRGTKGTVDGEFGGTTGRPRRMGWFDALTVRYAVEVNGISRLGLTKLDRLTGYKNLKIATGYLCGDQHITEFTTNCDVLSNCQAVYETLPGWSEDISSVTEFGALPKNAQAYIKRIEELVGAPVAMIGVGAERDQMIIR